MGRASRFSPEVRERAVRMVAEQASKHDSEWSAITSIAEKIGCAPETPGPLAGGYPRHNVVIISIDTLRPDHLSAYGYERPTSQALDGAASNLDAVAPELLPHLERAVALLGVVVDLPNLLAQHVVTLGPGAPSLGLALK